MHACNACNVTHCMSTFANTKFFIAFPVVVAASDLRAGGEGGACVLLGWRVAKVKFAPLK